MYEIELKAHVENRREVARALDSFAEYSGALTKRDTYYRLPLVCVPTGMETSSSKRADVKVYAEEQSHIGCRIRKTVYEKTGETKITFTYKRKGLRKDADGIAIEVNDEKECTLSETDAIESFIKDAGGGISHVKERMVCRNGSGSGTHRAVQRTAARRLSRNRSARKRRCAYGKRKTRDHVDFQKLRYR